jgi:hypothetical protein
MKPAIREIVNTRDRDALGAYIRDNLGLIVTDAHLDYIMEQATRAGGPEHGAWSDSTWRMWLKGRATQPPHAAASSEPRPSAMSRGVQELEATLIDASDACFSTTEYAFCKLSGANDYSEEVWGQLFPASLPIGEALRGQFEAAGGSKLIGRAPLASWLYARLVFLGVASVDEENDLGGYAICFVVKSNDRSVGVLFVEADSHSVDIHLEARTADYATSIKDHFCDLLLKRSNEVARCEIAVRGAEVQWTNSYGWTGCHFLGDSNVSG